MSTMTTDGFSRRIFVLLNLLSDALYEKKKLKFFLRAKTETAIINIARCLQLNKLISIAKYLKIDSYMYSTGKMIDEKGLNVKSFLLFCCASLLLKRIPFGFLVPL